MKTSNILQGVIFALVLVLAWMFLGGSSGYAQRSANKGYDAGEEAAKKQRAQQRAQAKKADHMAEKALKKASGGRRR